MSDKLFREWMKKAEEDYQIAVLLSRKKGLRFFDAICFHSQQTGEKYLKAYLALEKILFPKTHDLILLQKLCLKREGDFEFIADLAENLNPYAVAFRYPGDQANQKDAKRALSAAKGIREFIRTKTR